MTKNLKLLIAANPMWSATVAAAVVLVLSVLITNCEDRKHIQKNATSISTLQHADSVLNATTGKLELQTRVRNAAHDSVVYWKNKYHAADSTQQFIPSKHVQVRETYLRELRTAPDAARKRFLSERYPDLYPH